MDPSPHGVDARISPLWTDGDSVPWAPSEVAQPCMRAPEEPFVVQAGRVILMLEATDGAWTLAELAFNAEECLFRESRRATYTWPREAFGAMLGRLGASDLDEATMTALSDDFTGWLGDRFARVPCVPGTR